MIKPEETKYSYHLQSTRRLACEYDHRNYDEYYTTQMTPQFSEVFNSNFARTQDLILH